MKSQTMRTENQNPISVTYTSALCCEISNYFNTCSQLTHYIAGTVTPVVHS